MSPRIGVVEHQASCPPGLVGEWLGEAGCELVVHRPYLADPGLPDLTGYDAVLVLGGEMSANDDDTVAWLALLKAQIRALVADGTPLLGICLGHQLIASALGGRVVKNPAGQRVGLQAIGWTGEPDALFDPHTGTERCVHWHGDVVESLAPGSVVLARGPGDDIQVVRHAPAAWSVQGHPEADVHITRRWAESDRDDHVRLGIDQDRALGEIEAAHAELAQHWRPVLARFAQLAGA